MEISKKSVANHHNGVFREFVLRVFFGGVGHLQKVWKNFAGGNSIQILLRWDV